jgi:hypothetical protein
MQQRGARLACLAIQLGVRRGVRVSAKRSSLLIVVVVIAVVAGGRVGGGGGASAFAPSVLVERGRR